MRSTIISLATAGLVLTLVLSPAPASGQYREYYLHGLVVDTNNQPLAGAEVLIQDMATTRNYRVMTDKKGVFSIVGIPHGRYLATIKKAGFQTRTAEWDFSQPQDRIQKIEIETIVLASEAQVRKVEELKQAEARFKEATEKIRQGDLDGAIASLQAMIAANPADSNAYFLVGICYNRKKMPDEALAALAKVVALAPDFAGTYHQMGIAHQARGDQDQALEAYEKAIAKDPGLVDSLYNAGLILFGRSRIDEALAYFEKALALKPADPDLLEMAGRCYTNRGEFAKAVEYLEKAKAAVQEPEKVKFLAELIARLREQIKK
jgi:tetratricopeptide (TPR) repeat protein